MNCVRTKRAGVPLLMSLICLGCGADQGQKSADAAVDVAVTSDARPDGEMFPDAMMPSIDAPAVEAQPTQGVTAEVAFAEMAGSYRGKAANVSGSGLDKFDAGALYTFTIDPSGTITLMTKTTAEVFTWSQHGRTIDRNTNNKVTAVTLQDDNERVLVVTYRPTSGILDVAGAYFDPQGAWYLTEIAKL